MASSVILRNIKQLNKSLQNDINYIDFYYKGYSPKHDITLTKGSPLINTYKIWLQSKSTDYIRNYGHGGFFEDNLNRYPFSPDSESQIETDLIAESKKIFPNINILDCKVTCVPAKRWWNVKVLVSDKLTGLVGADMILDNESIVWNVDSIETNES